MNGLERKEYRMKKWMTVCLAAVTAAVFMAGCGSTSDAKETAKETTAASSEAETTKAETAAESEKETAAEDGTVQADEKSTAGHKESLDLQAAAGKHHIEINVKDYGTISVELDGDSAPITVANFMDLAEQGFYDGLIFHRVIKGFMIQGGDPQGTGMGGPGYGIKGEFAQNGVKNDLRHTAGVLSMARSMMPDSAGSQFFIMHKDAPHLDGAYAAFGKIIEGQDVVDAIAETATDYSDRPLEDQVMKTVVVDTFGEEYPEPETV